MMTFKYRLAQIVKLPPIRRALIPLAMSLAGVKPTLVDVIRLAVRTTDSIRPAQLTDHFKAFGIINQVLDV